MQDDVSGIRIGKVQGLQLETYMFICLLYKVQDVLLWDIGKGKIDTKQF